jgi:acyl carrier protein
MMAIEAHLSLPQVEQLVCDIASEQLGIARSKISPSDRLIEDLNCDSLDAVELLMELEDEFDVTIPNAPPNSAYKSVFTRQPFRLSDLAELIYLQQGSGKPPRKPSRRHDSEHAADQPRPSCSVPFTQLGGRWERTSSDRASLFESLETAGSYRQYRRRSDGMRCIRLPSASVEVGSDLPDALGDERPQHVVDLDSFLIDAEPISTTAFCRFLNSIGTIAPEVSADWFVLEPDDDRREHVLIQEDTARGWSPLPGAEKRPMILVSWFGANAYSLWANGYDGTDYRDATGGERKSFLPSEAQWEYAARGARFQPYPWGDEPPSGELMVYGLHRRSATYTAETLPLACVNEPLGMSPFGLHHMAGNVWQWCRDWYDERFYSKPEASRPNAVNRTRTPVRSERGGSWIGSAELCRSSYRRGRPPIARGRCLGFRCISSL